ncbi:MAG TPA: phosphoribosyltransferase [Jatrophihabitans sp.]|nr:phosphoribosyltransferase [Jatrophihabitans sp.]
MTAWSDQWAAGRLGITLVEGDADAPVLVTDLLELAVRRNPRRAHLLVSRVLGKHLPADPVLVYGTSRLLGAQVADALLGRDSGIAETGGRLLAAALAGRTTAAGELVDRCEQHASDVMVDAVVLGFAETATGLGHGVADSLAARYLHSTRRAGSPTAARFREEHSHAPDHLLLPTDPGLLDSDDPLVLVDDELSTGRTALNTIRTLHLSRPSRGRYLIAALADLRPAEDRDRCATLAAELGVRIEVVALATGRLLLPPDALARGNALVAAHDRPAPVLSGGPKPLVLHWPAGVRAHGRHGFEPAERPALEQAVDRLAAQLAPGLGRRVLVLGFEELMYAPLRIAQALAGLLGPSGEVRFSATTRSPVLTVDESGYPIRTGLAFPAADVPLDGPGPRYAYNIAGRRFTDIVLVVDDEADTSELRGPAGLLSQLAAACDQVQLVRIPSADAHPVRLPEPLHGPAFGSYRPDEVSWLLTDLSGIPLEAPTEDREEAIQAGGAHYAESLPVEYQPGERYQQLYRRALAQSTDRVAAAVGLVTEQVLAARGPNPVLVSLARAGTPVGILMRRWGEQVHGLRLPHYAVSIVRGRGIDVLALRYLAGQHDPAQVVFVDGWTGKGAIVRELAAAVDAANRSLRLPADHRFAAEPAVLADTGHCVRIFGTREDFLIPSACLNSTVSGLVSRTVLNDRYIGDCRYHGAKFYAELASADVSNSFLDAISDRFDSVREQVLTQARDRPAAEPSWQGWQSVQQLARRYGIEDLNLIKPGVGETTRVLLRRVPWKVLIRRDALAELGHLILLAEQRGVPVELLDELSYRCVGLIQPNFSRTPAGAGVSAGGARSPHTR